MPRPKSASDAQALSTHQAYVEPLSSPTKSILVREGMGTPGGKKKNVTFGDDVLENEEKRPLKTEDVPGKFPSSPAVMLAEDGDLQDDKPEKAKGKTKLTEALEQARDEGRKRKKGDKKGRKDMDEEESEVPLEFREPKSEVGKYWKREYDIYRANTQREVKKLITKQKAAKSFALTKDIEYTELSEQLRQEQRKVEELGTKTAELSAQMREMEEKLKASQEAEKRQADEIAVLKRQLGRRDSARPESSEGVAAIREQIGRSKADSAKRASREIPRSEADLVQRPSEPYRYSPEAEKPKLDIQTLRARLKAKQEPPPNSGPKSAEDIWAQSLGSSGPGLTRSIEKPLPSPKSSKAVTSGTEATPLQSLDINTLSLPKEASREVSVGSMEVEVDGRPFDSALDKPRRDSPLQSPSLSMPSASELHLATSTAVKQESVPLLHTIKAEEKDDLSISIPVPESSPFQHKPLPSRPAGPREAMPTRPTPQLKENVRPALSSSLQPEVKEKPSILWNSIGTAQSANNSAASMTSSKRNASLTAKDGREVSSERVEAAKARLMARKVSRLEGN
jgi:hypothetical protein